MKQSRRTSKIPITNRIEELSQNFILKKHLRKLYVKSDDRIISTK